MFKIGDSVTIDFNKLIEHRNEQIQTIRRFNGGLPVYYLKNMGEIPFEKIETKSFYKEVGYITKIINKRNVNLLFMDGFQCTVKIDSIIKV